MKKLLTAAAIVAIISTPGIAKTKVLAKVNNVAITSEDLNELVKNLPPQYDKNDPKVRQELINFLIDQEILVQEAKKEGLDKDPEVKRQIENAIKQILATALLNKKVKPESIKVTEKEVKEYYEKNKNAFKGLDGKPLPYQQIRDFLAQQLEKEKQQKAVHEYLNKIKKKYKVEIVGDKK